MEIRFVVTKEERKVLVKAIGAILGCSPAYKGAPSFAFEVQNYTIDRYGTLIFNEYASAEDVQHLLAELTIQGFVYEGTGNFSESSSSIKDAEASADTNAHDKLAIEVPIDGFTSTAVNNLERLVLGKAELIMQAIGADALPIERFEGLLRFPWFPITASGVEVDAYSRFIHALCEMAKKQKRVTMKQKERNGEDSDKFRFRCFLLRLGFVGDDTKPARKILLSKLSGNSSFKSGDHKSRGVMADV